MTPPGTDLKNATLEDIQSLTASLGAEPYRARQIFSWLYRQGVTHISDMTDIPLNVRKYLAKIAHISSLDISQTRLSCDGSKKYVFRTHDGFGIESVLIPEKSHSTLCLSTQIGCAMKCSFCFTGHTGLVRNLTAAEIVNQVCAILHAAGTPEKLPNIVFMGMGEPLANYENTVKSISVLTNPCGLQYSHRKITVSTSGLVPEMDRLGKEVSVNMAVSLNAPNDEIRSRIMPVNKKYPLRELLAAAARFPLRNRQRITFEYILLRGINDAPEHALQLARLLRSVPCKINLIPYNAHAGSSFRSPEETAVMRFQEILRKKHFTAPVRRSKGQDIAAACGQLGLSLSS